MLNFFFKSGFRRATLAVELRGVNGFTGSGEVDYSAWRDGSRQMEIELRGVAGRLAELYGNGARIAAIEINNGRVDRMLDTQQGDSVPLLDEGAMIEIVQNGQPILGGKLVRD